MQQRRRDQGFSLLELMVVLTLLAVLALLATPSMTEWMKNQRIRGTAEALQNGLQTARAEAIRRNRPASFWLVSDLTASCSLSGTSGNWVVSLHSPQGGCNAAPSATSAPLLVASHAAEASVDVNAVDASGNAASEVRFDGYGRLATPLGAGDSVAHIDIRDPADAAKGVPANHTYRSLRVQVLGTGAVRLCDPRITAAGDTRHCL